MARLVRFHGRAHHLPNDSMTADPVPGIWYVGARPPQIPASVPCFTEKVFDRALAEHCGRVCGPACAGDCFAELYAAVGNINDARVSGRQKNETLFTVLPWPPATEPAVAPASAPDSAPDAAPDPTPVQKPARRAAKPARRAAKPAAAKE